MKFYCRVTPQGLIPLDDIDFEAKKKLRPGSDVLVQVSMPRNIRFHRKFFALLHIVLDNLPKQLQKKLHVYSVETLLAAIKIDLGYFDTFNVDGRDVVKLRSISFAKMSEGQFAVFYDRAVAYVLSRLIPGTDRADLIQAVEQFTQQPLLTF